MATLTTVGVNIIKDVRGLIEDMIPKTTGYKRDGADLKIRIMMINMGVSETAGTVLANSTVLKLAKSVYGEEKEYYPTEGLININTDDINRLLYEPAKLNDTLVTKLYLVIFHEILHILCVGVHPNPNYGWGAPKLGLVGNYNNKNGGWLYTGKPDSKAVKFYRETYCDNMNIEGIPIEDDDDILGHLEEGYDNEGNFVVRNIDGNKYYPVPFEIMSTYHTPISFTSPITMGILEDYGYFINWNNKELIAARNILESKRDTLGDMSLGEAITKSFS